MEWCGDILISNESKKIEELANKKGITSKTFKDINFLLAKFKYHTNNFEKIYPEFIRTHEEIGKEKVIDLLKQTETITGAKPGTFNNAQRKMQVNIHSQIIHPLFFELDILMIDARRIVEYFIKFIADLSDEKPPEKIHSFFEGLENKSKKQSIFIKKLVKQDKDYVESLKREWKNWINELSDYRSKSIHKSVERMMDCTVTVYWNQGSNIENPDKTEMSSIKLHETDIVIYINNLWKNMSRFIMDGSNFIIKNF